MTVTPEMIEARQKFDRYIVEITSGLLHPNDYRPELDAVIAAALAAAPEKPHEMVEAWKIVRERQKSQPPRHRVLRMVVYPYARTYATFAVDEDSEDWAEGNGDTPTLDAIRLAASRIAEEDAVDD